MNAIAVDGVPEADIVATRRTLLSVIQNLARDEIEFAKDDRRIPSTRELSRRVRAAGLAREDKAVERNDTTTGGGNG